jgi:DNA-binding HxlR family transcriptional regulator
MESSQYSGPTVVQATLKVLLILWHLKEQPKRYSELKRLIPEVSEKMLIQQLRELEVDGIIDRTTLTEVPLKVEYAFTQYGETLKPVIETLCEWGQQHLERIHTGKPNPS